MGKYYHHHNTPDQADTLMNELTLDERRALIPYLRTFITEKRDARILEVLANRTRHFAVVLENLYQTQNISAVMRTCECYGVQDVHIIEKENDFVIHDAISMGANKWLTLHNYPNEEGNVVRCADALHSAGYKLYATLPAENSVFVDDLPVEQKAAFFFGTELTGLSEEAVAVCDGAVKIPMYGFTESFNISNSVAILTSNRIERLHRSGIDWRLTPDEHDSLYFEWLCKSIRNIDLILKRKVEEGIFPEETRG